MKNRIYISILASILFFGGATLSLADNVVDDVTAGGTDTITSGGYTTVNYKIVATRNDGQTGCNPDDGSSATVTIIKPASVTTNVLSLVFSSCNDFEPVVFSSNTPGNYLITVSVSDSGAGSYNTNPAAFTLHVLPPVVTNTVPTLIVPSPIVAEATGSTGAVVNYSVSASDLEDGPLTPTCNPISGSTFSLGTTNVSCSVTDSGGLTVTGSFDVSVVDTTAPTIESHLDETAEATSASGAAVSYTSPATHDAVDGDGTATCSPASGSTFPLDYTTVYCDATDAHGNAATQTSFTVHVVDTTPPNVTWGVGVSDVGSYDFGFVPPAPTCSAEDVNLVSELSTCEVTGYDTSVGTHTLTATGTDKRGNSASLTLTYTVKAWIMKGYYQPTDMNGVLNTVKNGATVPLKFEVFASLTELTSTTQGGNPVVTFTVNKITCGTNAVEDTIEQFTTTGGTSLRYDTTAGQFIQNWQTPKQAGSCFKVTSQSQDGVTVLAALFKLK